MLNITPQQINPLTISNYSTKKKPYLSKSQKYVIFDNKENTISNDELMNNHFSLDFKENKSAMSLIKDTAFLHQKRKRLRKISDMFVISVPALNPKQKEFPSAGQSFNEEKDKCISHDYSNYTDEEYQFDLMTILKERKHLFMYKNFPSSYNKKPFFYTIKTPKQSNLIKPSLRMQNPASMIGTCDMTSLPKGQFPLKKWSPLSLANDFLDQLESKWNYSIADFSIEFILEFVMKNNYRWNFCLENSDECEKYVRGHKETMNTRRYWLRNQKLTKFNHGVFNNDHFEYYQ